MDELSNNSRRSFIKTIGTVTAGALGAAAATPVRTAWAGPSASDLIFSTPTAAVSFKGGTPFGVTGAEGGYPLFPVIEAPDRGVNRKSLDTPRFQDFSMAVGGDLPRPFRAALQGFFNRNQTPIDGTVSYLDRNFALRGALQFQEGIFTEFTLPAVDVTAREEFLDFRGKMSFASAKRDAGDLSKITFISPKASIVAANFRLRIDGLDTVFSEAQRIAAIRVSQPVIARDESTITVGPMNVSDLITTLVESDAQPLYDWFDENLSGKQQERNGSLEFLSRDRSRVVVGFDLKNVNLWWLADEDGVGNTLKRVTAKMYVEEIALRA